MLAATAGTVRTALRGSDPSFSVASISKLLRIAKAPQIRPQVLAELAGSFAREKSLMAKVARQTAVKKTSKATPTPIKPVKQALTKSALVNLIAEKTRFRVRRRPGSMRLWKTCFLVPSIRVASASSCLPGLLKVSLRKVPARKAGTLVRSPATGEMVEASAKPASVRVKIRALSKLKTAATP
jgi:hypothetical protein